MEIFDNSIYLGGYLNLDYALWKFDIQGNFKNVSTHDFEENYDFVNAMAFDTTNAAIYLAGSCKVGGGNHYDGGLVKFDTSGAVLWAQQFNGLGFSNDDFLDIILDSEGSVYVTGIAADNIYTFKYAPDGNLLWKIPYDLAYGRGTALTLDQAGNVFVTGFNTPGQSSLFTTIKYSQSPVGIQDNDVGITDGFILHQNYPNPFNDETTIRFSLKNQTKVTIEVFDMLGQKVKTLLNKKMQAGKHQVSWNGCDEMGARLQEGFYFCNFEAGNYSQTRKMLLMK